MANADLAKARENNKGFSIAPPVEVLVLLLTVPANYDCGRRPILWIDLQQ
jgi:hypothetical protein